MIKFLVIEQDLRVSGTSQGIISRSFLGKLRIAYPDSIIDVVYLKQAPSNDQLELLPVNNIQTHVLNLKIPFLTKWLNKIYWRLFHISLNEEFIHNVYASEIAKIDYNKYDFIFIRSSGIDHEMLLAVTDLPILKKSILVFHDPYPVFWYSGANIPLKKIDLGRFQKMFRAVCQAKTCISSAAYMSRDLEFLYGTRKHFFTLPHQYSENLFNLSKSEKAFKKSKNVTISYHGAIQFGRNIEIVLDAYIHLIESSVEINNQTEFILRLKSNEYERLLNKYRNYPQIIILESADFATSCYEQQQESDILIILENGPIYCNILVGKAPVLASFKKPVLSISPKISELRNILTSDIYIADMLNFEDVKLKLNQLILSRLKIKENVYPFGNYFSDEVFKNKLDLILNDNKS
jgi:hypothetical protein